MALSGVLLTLFGISVPVWFNIRLQSQLQGLRTEYNLLNKEVRYLQQDFQQATGKHFEDITQSDLYLPGITPELRAKYKEIEFRIIKEEASITAIEKTQDYIYGIYALEFICVLGGALLALFGFRFWYQRVQKYEDLIIRNEAEKHCPNTK